MSALLEALKAVTKEDLDSCESEIVRLESELFHLKTARQLMRTKLGLVVDKVAAMREGQKRRRRAVASSEDSDADDVAAAVAEPVDSGSQLLRDRRIAIYQHLQRNGATKMKVLCEKLKIPEGLMGAILNYQWFKRTDRGIELA